MADVTYYFIVFASAQSLFLFFCRQDWISYWKATCPSAIAKKTTTDATVPTQSTPIICACYYMLCSILQKYARLITDWQEY